MKKPEIGTKKTDVIDIIFHSLHHAQGDNIWTPKRKKGLAFAPTNVALCKYWGKRDNELNLPMTSSLSVALPDKGALTSLTLIDQAQDEIILNGNVLAADSRFVQNTVTFLDLFRRVKKNYFRIDISMNLPIAAGLASSACGYASLVLALNDLFTWHLSVHDLSILARLGSGSAARSFWMGFVEWNAGVQSDGMDSFAEPLNYVWQELYLGILIISEKEKPISSREAMLRTVNTSIFYRDWPKKVAQDMVIIRQALQIKNFALLGGVSESNALAMHATMLSSWPPISYALPETTAAMLKVWRLRHEGLDLYFTQDAGPNLKLLFLEKNKDAVLAAFPDLEVVRLFE